MSTLYVVATPIGNLEDVTLRALRVLGEVDAIAAEDTRVTGRLLARHGIKRRMLSYRAPVEERALPRVLATLESGDVALVTAHRGDRFGNLRHRLSSRNFNPVMAMAARLTIAEVREVVPPGTIEPDDVHTPGIFVDRVVQVGGTP